MNNDYAEFLQERSETLDAQGKHEQAAEVAHLATLADRGEDNALHTVEGGDFYGTVLADVEETTTDWLWRNWLPLGCVTIFAGVADGGKSTFMADLMARVTTDRVMPDGTPCEAPGGAIVISLEEKTSSTVVPRLRVAEADLTRIIDLSAVQRAVHGPDDPAYSPFMLPDDLPILERAVKAVNATLVVIDPLMSAVNPKVSTFRNQSARQVVSLFQEMADRLGIAIVIVNHFIKGGAKNPLEAMAGSKGFTDIVRSAIMLSKDASNAARRVLSLVKHNLAPDVPQIVFTLTAQRRVSYLAGLTPAEQRAVEQAQLSQSRKDVLGVLEAAPTREFTPSQLAQMTSTPYDTMKKQLRRMTDAGQIVCTARGFYQAVPPVPPLSPKKQEKEPLSVAAPLVPLVPLSDRETMVLAKSVVIPQAQPVEQLPTVLLDTAQADTVLLNGHKTCMSKE